mmetsp:Transcript_16324/g.37760  ORF Transcript_16324/g.37760 Transcript_16324/m.37760 type:complete len:362 (+) Transcript_16324:59-1144(+)
MSNNPLLGNRISLISKKNIRYEGILYSINEQSATVALKNVKSFGTEGRELLDTTGNSTFVPPNDVVHSYLLFRGQDIKDLHVHENLNETSDDAPTDPPVAAQQATDESLTNVPAENPTETPVGVQRAGEQAESIAQQRNKGGEKLATDKKDAPRPREVEAKENSKPTQPKKGSSNRKSQNMVGTGASLLNKKARGVKGENLPKVEGEFDFESNLAEFDKAKITSDDEVEDSFEDKPNGNEATIIDNADEDEDGFDGFFDTISSDATDRANGIDNRLRGAQERNLNLDTFGATSLGNNRRRYYNGSGRGRGRGRSRGRGRGRGRGNSSRSRRQGNGGGGGGGYHGNRMEGTAPTPRQNNRWN